MILTKAHIAKTIHDRLDFTNDPSAQLVESLLESIMKTRLDAGCKESGYLQVFRGFEG